MKVYQILLFFLTVTSLTFGQSSTTGTTEAPDLNIGIVDTNIELNWDDTHSFDLHVSSNLSDWTNTNVNSSPHSEAVLNVRNFYKLVESEPELDTSAPVISITA